MTVSGLKEEGKGMSPMFPKVHANETEKGGPRASPRNQMSIFEQFSIPSQSRLSGSASTLPLPPNSKTRSSFIPSVSPTQGHSHERNLPAPSCKPRGPSPLFENLKSSSACAIQSNTATDTKGAETAKVSNFTLNTKRPLSPSKQSNKLPPYSFPGFGNLSLKNTGVSNFSNIPNISQTGVDEYSNSNQVSKGCEEVPRANSCFLLQLRAQSQSPQNPLQGSCSIPWATAKGLRDASSTSSIKIKESETFKRSQGSADQEKVINSDEQDCTATEENTNLGDELTSKFNGSIASKTRNENFLLKALKYDKGSHEKPENRCGREWVVDSNPHHYVIRAIGEKQFWKIRTSLMNQQRIFSAQVFELHRLIMVQKFISGSPHLLHEDSNYADKRATSSPVNKPPLILKPAPIPGPKDLIVKPKSEAEEETAIQKLPLPSISSNANKEFMNMNPGQLPLNPASTNTRQSSSWCLPGPGNQWLVPIMSPSEGLIYKPVAGPNPPTIAPGSGVPGPISLPGGEFLKTAFGFPPPPSHSYFSPYCMPVLNLPVPSSAIDRVTPFTQVSAHHGSGNVSSQSSQAAQRCFKKPQVCKGSELQRSTASSPAERSELPLFPTEPSSKPSDRNNEERDQKPVCAIKVVPHNPRLASESAARIFHFIQEERGQYE